MQCSFWNGRCDLVAKKYVQPFHCGARGLILVTVLHVQSFRDNPDPRSVRCLVVRPRPFYTIPATVATAHFRLFHFLRTIDTRCTGHTVHGFKEGSLEGLEILFCCCVVVVVVVLFFFWWGGG